MEPLLHHCPCRVQQVAATGIVAEPLPELEDLRFVCARQRDEIRIGCHPPREVGQHRLDLGLLKHELRDQHLIGVVILAPGQPAGVDRKPVRQQPAAERLPALRGETVPRHAGWYSGGAGHRTYFQVSPSRGRGDFPVAMRSSLSVIFIVRRTRGTPSLSKSAGGLISCILLRMA